MRCQLTLLRHAKSAWDDPATKDRDRPLNERGERDAPLMGQRLRARNARPTLFMTSPAVRARRTAQIVAHELGYPAEFLQYEKDLYLASAKQIIAVLARQASSNRDIVVCGHNPGITALANRLTGAAIDNIPTAGIVIIGLDLERWADLDKAEGELLLFDYPRRSSQS
ncbi:MAG: histidine phosphatase family protein [Gammaproteobacteria bacterium]|nr:histidine phosphatase family protein [Gammaproteobacteria bacterium]